MSTERAADIQGTSILGGESHMASCAALAAAKQGAYEAFHQRLISLNGAITPAIIET